MSGRTLQFLRYRKEKVDLRSLFIAVSFRSVSDSDVTQKSESMTVGVKAGWLGNMAESGCMRNSEMLWLFLQCLGSEWFFGWFADQKNHLAYCWWVLGPIEERDLILWLKVCGVFFLWTKMASYLLSLLLPSPSISYNSLNNAWNGSGFHMEQQENTLYK